MARGRGKGKAAKTGSNERTAAQNKFGRAFKSKEPAAAIDSLAKSHGGMKNVVDSINKSGGSLSDIAAQLKKDRTARDSKADGKAWGGPKESNNATGGNKSRSEAVKKAWQTRKKNGPK